MKPKTALSLSIICGVIASISSYMVIKASAKPDIGPILCNLNTAVAAGDAIDGKYEQITLPSNFTAGRELEEIYQVYVPYDKIHTIQIGNHFSRALGNGSLIRWDDIDLTQQRGNLEIPVDKRAVTIRASETSSVAYSVKPGDVVDILGLFRKTNNDGTVELASRLVLKKVEVIAVGDRITTLRARNWSESLPDTYNTVTVAVDVKDAMGLDLAQNLSIGGLTLALRNPDDQGVRSQEDITLDQWLASTNQ